MALTDDRRSIERNHSRLLFRLEAGLEMPMFGLALAWLWLFAVELIRGLTPFQDRLVLLIWALFLFEFALKLWLAPDKRRYMGRNLVTLVALVIPAFRAFRLLRAIRILRAGRVVSATRFVRALTSTDRFVRELREAQGPPPEPEMHVGVMLASGSLIDPDRLQGFATRLAEDIQRPLEQGTTLRWTFHDTESAVLPTDNARRPSDFLDDASQRMAEGAFDLMLVITDVPLSSRRRQAQTGLASPTTRTLVLSTRRLTAASRNNAARRLDSPAVRWNAAALVLHLTGHILGLGHRSRQHSAVMTPYRFSESRSGVPQFNAREQRILRKRADRLPERELRGGNAFGALVFHILMAFRHPREVIVPLARNRAILLPLSLPGLATAAVAPVLLLIFTAEIWDVGLNMSNQTAALYASLSIAAASFYLMRIQNLFLPRREKRTLTEHLAVANTVIFLSIFMACIGLFLMVGALTVLIEVYIFPEGLIQTWPTLDRPVVGMTDMLRLACFVSTIGVTTGALAGGLENRTVIQHLALFMDRE